MVFWKRKRRFENIQDIVREFKKQSYSDFDTNNIEEIEEALKYIITHLQESKTRMSALIKSINQTEEFLNESITKLREGYVRETFGLLSVSSFSIKSIKKLSSAMNKTLKTL